jgi:Protein of unknown function (DUF551)
MGTGKELRLLMWLKNEAELGNAWGDFESSPAGSWESPEIFAYLIAQGFLMAGDRLDVVKVTARLWEVFMRNCWWNAKTTVPLQNIPLLVRGTSYDASYQDGYAVATYNVWNGKGVWHYGKQQTEMQEVTHWMVLPPEPEEEK